MAFRRYCDVIDMVGLFGGKSARRRASENESIAWWAEMDALLSMDWHKCIYKTLSVPPAGSGGVGVGECCRAGEARRCWLQRG